MKKIVFLFISLLVATSCFAQQKQEVQLDTMVCKVNCIDKFCEVPTANGKSTRIYAVYNDSSLGISELIPVSKSVYTYIQTCKANGLKPTLGIKLRNGQISSIIRYKQIFVRKNEKR